MRAGLRRRASPVVDQNPVQAGLGHLHRVGRQRPPPPPGGEAHRRLHRALAVAPPWRARHHRRPVVLGHGGEAGLHVARRRFHHRGHAVHPPHPGGAAQAAQHAVHGLDEMRLIGGGGDHAPAATRVGQGAQQHEAHPAPRGLAALEPVPLDLLARRVGDVDRVPADDAGAGLAVGAQPGVADLAHEARVAQRVAELGDLVEQRRPPHVRVVREAGPQVGGEPLQRVGVRPPADPGLPAFDVGLDGSPVTADVAGDRDVRPPSFPECLDLHVLSLCEHEPGAPPCWTAQTPPAWGEPPARWWTLDRPDQVTQGPTFSVIDYLHGYVILNNGSARGGRRLCSSLR